MNQAYFYKLYLYSLFLLELYFYYYNKLLYLYCYYQNLLMRWILKCIMLYYNFFLCKNKIKYFTDYKNMQDYL